MMTDNFRLYVHIPFCVRKCAYCDFLSAPAEADARESYVRNLIREISGWKNSTLGSGSGRKAASLYIGGGTPSILELSQTERIFEALRETFEFCEDAEITTEVNPGTLDREKARGYYALGINRISLGLQSVHDGELKALGRIHDWKMFLDSYDLARQAGFENVNVDLISALPGQTCGSWEQSLCTVASLRPEHLSAYSLILEPGTPMGDDPPADLPDEDTERRMYELTGEVLGKYGYEQYEISNYALPGMVCCHNIGYWTGDEYLGLGLGASSYLDGKRLRNTPEFSKYPGTPEVVEEIDLYGAMTEYMILGLRMTEGVSMETFRNRFGYSVSDVFGKEISKYENGGFMKKKNDRIMLTRPGINVSNTIFADLMLATETFSGTDKDERGEDRLH